MLILQKEGELKVMQTPFGTIRYIEHEGQKWIVRADFFKACGYMSTIPKQVAGQMSKDSFLMAERSWRQGASSQISFMNETGVREFQDVKLGKVKARRVRPQLCEFVLKNLYKTMAATPEPVPLFSKEETDLNEAIAALEKVFRYLKGMKR